jgi:membrane protein CcdC involved in cytochrome C biogenesis
VSGSSSPITIAIIIAFMGWILYRRGRRMVGRQKVKARSLLIRAAIYLAIGVLVGAAIINRLVSLEDALLGLAIGLLAAWVGLRLTSFERAGEDVFYKPNTYLGLGILVLLIARIVYRFAVTLPQLQQVQQSAGGNPFAAYGSSPIALILLFMYLGYYLFYNLAVLTKARALRAAS